MFARDYYDNFYFHEDNPDYSELLSVISKYKVDGSILDYGCGDGHFLKFFQGNGFKCTGAEYAPDLVQTLKEKYSNITFYSLNDFWQKENVGVYNFIHLGDVLEHLTEPAEMIKKISEKLNKHNGYIIVRGPMEDNFSFGHMCRYFTAWLIKKLKPVTLANHVPYHITFSNFKNQEMIFDRAGIEKVYYKVWETPWPYPDKPEGGVGEKLKYLLGQVSTFVANTFSNTQGNRFLYIGKLKNDAVL